MDERRHVDELDRRARCERTLTAALIERSRQEHQHGPQPLSAGRQRLGADATDQAGVRADGAFEAQLEHVEVGVEPGRRANRGERAHARLFAVCSATIPPARRRQRISSNPLRSIAAASSRGPGKRRTLAGRYA